MEDPQLFDQFKGHKDAITASKFSPNGKQVPPADHTAPADPPSRWSPVPRTKASCSGSFKPLTPGLTGARQ